MVAVIILKFVLWRYCQQVSSLLSSDAIVEAMAQDHINDCLSNVVAVFALALARQDYRFWWADPVGALIISLYIMYSWFQTGSEEIEKIVGKAAGQEVLDKLNRIGATHHNDLTVDCLRCYHFGERYLVEMEVRETD